MNHATTASATTKEMTKPITSTIHSCVFTASGARLPSAAVLRFGSSVLKRSYNVATTIVGIDRKKENSSAAGRDRPAIWPAAIVDIERDVPGKTAERI